MNEIFKQIEEYGIIPVVAIKEQRHAAPLAKALCEGGLSCAEITFRTEAAKESIRIMKEQFPNMLIGAGTILTPKQAEDAILAGASFLVSPGLNPKVVRYCQERKVPILPGVVTPSEIEQALELSLEVVKFFPAEPSGGLAMIKALAAPYSMLKFMPTGGINETNVKDYLGFEKILACGGSWMVKPELLDREEFDTIRELTRQAKDLVEKVRREG